MVNAISKPARELLSHSFWFPLESDLLANQKRLDSYFSLAVQSEKESFWDSDPFYSHTDSLALNTSYEDFYQLLSWAKDHHVQSIVDLGCGMARLPLMASYLFPQIKVLGLEAMKERIVPAKNHLNLNSQSVVRCGDLLGPWPELWREYSLYFIYLPTGKLLRKIIFELSKKGHAFYIAAIESHGQLIHELEEDHDWIQPVEKLPLKQKRHDPYLYIFHADPKKISSTPLKGVFDLEKDRLAYDALATEKEIISLELPDGRKRFFFTDDLHPIRYSKEKLCLESDTQTTIIETWKSSAFLSHEDPRYQRVFDILVSIADQKLWSKVFEERERLWADDRRGKRDCLS